jgi:site-specific DNA-methyltransferase (adenine-specific)
MRTIDAMSPSWQVITGNSLEVMPTLQPGSERLVFADPPYKLGVDYGAHHNDRLSPAAYLAWSDVWIGASARLLTPDGSLWLPVNHEWAWQLVPCTLRAGLHLRQWVTWYETFGVNCTHKFNRCSRPLLWFTRNPHRFVFNDGSEVRRQSDCQTKYNDKRANPAGKLLDDVWMIPRLAGTHRERIKGFPTQLPVGLLRPIVGCASSPDDLVLDPFTGSGTSGQAALELGRRFLGIEGNDHFAGRARMRLKSIGQTDRLFNSALTHARSVAVNLSLTGDIPQSESQNRR